MGAADVVLLVVDPSDVNTEHSPPDFSAAAGSGGSGGGGGGGGSSLLNTLDGHGDFAPAPSAGGEFELLRPQTLEAIGCAEHMGVPVVIALSKVGR